MPIPGKVTGEITEIVTADLLTINTVMIRIARTLDIEEGNYPLANNPILEFNNSPNGRVRLQESVLPKEWKDAIMLVWGDEPTVEDPAPPEEVDPHPPYIPEEPEDPDPEE